VEGIEADGGDRAREVFFGAETPGIGGNRRGRKGRGGAVAAREKENGVGEADNGAAEAWGRVEGYKKVPVWMLYITDRKLALSVRKTGVSPSKLLCKPKGDFLSVFDPPDSQKVPKLRERPYQNEECG
jgi:hypothetical protein